MNQNHLFIYRLKFDCEFQIFNVISDFLPPNEHLLVNNAVLISIFEGRKKRSLEQELNRDLLQNVKHFSEPQHFISKALKRKTLNPNHLHSTVAAVRGNRLQSIC